jgi:hypothetical protein
MSLPNCDSSIKGSTFTFRFLIGDLSTPETISAIFLQSLSNASVGSKSRINHPPLEQISSVAFTAFSIDSKYYSEEMLEKYFQGNFYGQLLKDNLKLKYNLEGYLYNNKYDLFKNVQYWETMLNTIEDLCINLPMGLTLTGGVYLNNNITNLYEFIQDINTQALICKNQSSGMKDSGIKIEFNYILQEITTKYIEYIIYDRTNADNLSKARLNFINNTDFEKVISDVRMYLLFYFNIITDAVKKDFEKQNNETNKNQIIYSILFLIVNVEIIISLVFIFSKTEKYKKLFSYFSTIPKDDIINI